MTADIFKPGFDGERGSLRLSGPEKQIMRVGRPELVRRLHEAALTLNAQKVSGPAQMRSNSPAYIVEFSDRVGEEESPPPPVRFEPTAAQVTDMPKALALLDGLRRPFYKVVFLRALHEFLEANGERSDWTWEKIGKSCGFSGVWAEGAYTTAIIQAARRSGLLPMVTADYSLVIAAVDTRFGWLTNLGTAADPRQAISNLRSKSPLRIDESVAVWVNGAPVAKRIFDELKPDFRSRVDHGAWYKAHPDVLLEAVTAKARELKAVWHIEDIRASALAA